MPLDHYGVLVGTLTAHHRDPPDEQGRWFHVNLTVAAPAGHYHCAVDVDSKQSATGVQWRLVTLPADRLPTLGALTTGCHPLATTSSSGALDYPRHPAFRLTDGCLTALLPPAVRRWLAARAWSSGSHLEAATALESILAPGARTAIFGEPFERGLGMHNIHQNQGDPAGSQWWAENGTWQDGATVVFRPDGRYDVFLSKFTSQSYETDDAGHPR
ncbi:DUF2278 family protein [Micromonospora coxensis]|uniref:Uncharacterized conserved protein n=1 Tax=Micromonospora coxensis TaxID=356852 RepID=A0A1C5JYD4_9ACTN|nr:DUF2278 family protein [Micromonospora coxensis]SCG75555.1 Uncharacterized conserved protein [Micromonospora coxensis]